MSTIRPPADSVRRPSPSSGSIAPCGQASHTPGQTARQAKASPEGVSDLAATVARINATLDLDTVLREIVDSARGLTGARYGVITTIGDPGEPQDYVLAGFTDEERRQMADWMPSALRLFDHLRDLPAPLRMPDLRTHVASLGLSDGMVPCRAFQAMPMRHSGEHVGSFFLSEKEDGAEFTDADEEVLVLFASRAASAIANARTLRDERRARADLETLVDTCPVGMVVFEAATGLPLSFNREVTRITSRLRVPGRAPLELLEMVTARFADGREVSLDQLTAAETLRGEEMELSVPDGRSLRMLVNVTPIRSDRGDVKSVVVTMQDLAPLEELERSRAEFLHLVSHELRAPLTSIKGSAASALRPGRTPDPAEARQFFRIIEEQADRMSDLLGDLVDAGRIDAGTLSVDPLPAEVADLADKARNTFLSGGGRHRVLMDLPPDLPTVLADERRIVQVLNNLFANAARYSPESSPIRVSAEPDGLFVAVSVADEGDGVPPEFLPRLFRGQPLALARRSERPVGSGLGLAICKGLVEAHGGRISAESAGAGRGTRLAFTLPVTEATVLDPQIKPTAVAFARRGRSKTPVLVVDDDANTLRYVRGVLSDAGYTPIVTGDPQEVPDLVRSRRPALVLLDLMLPRTDGIELMKSVPELSDLPVVFISAYGRDETVAKALESGAADYIVKPFSPTELTARVRSALRLRGERETFALDGLAIDYARRRVTLAGSPVRLTPTEYELLRLLSLNAGRVVTHASLLRRVRPNGATGQTEPVRGFVKRLRRKLGDDAARPAYIFNERGVGYRMPGPDGD